MPPWLDEPGELGVLAVAVITVGGSVIAAMIAAGGVVLTAWAKLKPLLAATAQDAAHVRHEVSANHGSSMRDAVTRVESAVAQVGTDLRELRRDMGASQRSNDAIHEDHSDRLRTIEQRLNT